MEPGLTMVVGPPGTGKTDVAVQVRFGGVVSCSLVQIISNIYHNWPDQRTLIVTHSNQAMNQLFEKIIALDIDERHCLRMGASLFEHSMLFRSWRRIVGDREGLLAIWSS